MKTINTGSDDYTAIFHSRLLMTHELTFYDILLCRHTVQIYSLRSHSELLNATRKLTLYRGDFVVHPN